MLPYMIAGNMYCAISCLSANCTGSIVISYRVVQHATKRTLRKGNAS